VTEPEKPEQHFTNYTPRNLSVFRQGYSIFVRVAKYALPLAALVIVCVLITRLTTGNSQVQNLASEPAAEKTTPGQIELVQPKYEGVDEKGQPYTVTADKATRLDKEPDNILFTNPVADITLTDKTWLAAKATSGTFNHTTDVLDLKDNVTIFHDSGYELDAQDLRIYLKLKTARTTLPVHAQGPIGTITAQNMSVLNQGNLIIFGGPATLTLFSLAGRKAHG
jgi:lipopolysaccharide export system protein LptC